MTQAQKTQLEYNKAMPAESPLEMPRRALYEEGTPLTAKRDTAYLIGTFLSRKFVLFTFVLLSYFGIHEIYSVIKQSGITILQWVFLILFSINFIWISYAFSQALLGFLLSFLPKRKIKEIDVTFKTAILLPVYNENPSQVVAAIEAMRNDLLDKANSEFAFFILSDTNKPQNLLAEASTLMPLVTKSTNTNCPVYYRRRSENTERKAGNIADWVQRWGGAYEAMLILDADSLMSAECIISLTRRLAANPKLGLIQTLPTIIRSNTLYGKLQQFANHCYGPIYARGLAAWHGMTSNFWGHNAIIRTHAFAASSCLPILKGKPPFGGHILSHDFIEAALLRRAGWGVRFDTDLQNSFEQAPPSLADVLVRDRRWCQGNLQHLPFMFAQGFTLPTRLHIFAGIMSYLSAVFWLLMIILGLGIALQAMLVRPEYFANPSLFPTWPVFDAERALQLFFISMGLVLAPKLFGWIRVMLRFRLGRAFGDPIRFTFNVIIELLLSALYAPILLVSQFYVVYSILSGKDSGWSPQSRDDGALSWSTVKQLHTSHTLFGLLLAGISWYLSIELFLWLLPISAGLILSIPLSWLSGGAKRIKWLHKLGLLRAPYEKYPHSEIIKSFENKLSATTGIATNYQLSALLNNPDFLQWHLAQITNNEDNQFNADRITAEWKIQNSDSLNALQNQLTHEEFMAVLESPRCLNLLTQHFIAS